MRNVLLLVALLCLSTACQVGAPAATDTPEVAGEVFVPAMAATPTMSGKWTAFYTLEDRLTVACEGIQMTVIDVGLAEPDAMMDVLADTDQEREAMAEGLEQVVGVGAIRLCLENTTDNDYFVYPSQGRVGVGRDVIGLTTYVFLSDDIDGELVAGESKEGVIRFGLENIQPDAVESLHLIIPSPADQDLEDICEGDLEARITLQAPGQ